MDEVEFKALRSLLTFMVHIQIHYYTQKAWFIKNSIAIFAIEQKKKTNLNVACYKAGLLKRAIRPNHAMNLNA